MKAAESRSIELVVAGGLLKNTFLMQVYADVCRRPLSLIGSEQGPALGSAIFAAVAAGAFPDIHAAAGAMGKVRRAVYRPNEKRAVAYDALYAEYVALHDWFGRGGNDVLHRLRAERRAVLGHAQPKSTVRVAEGRGTPSAAPKSAGFA